ncbi:hypothetical protein ASE16_02240 [Leifsonia sp. Root227]|uniref:mannitol dehydrogenase family protein n=1 Tax=Leifsonia sp. Root227 TaxID=1736496 RepID=UPI0006F7A645|nr:mannitol dehydrogenase family protein [Leifsonia sp. Root227]KRC51911.1 hypothetical protein ASE16_02240 [Leifsonia sp. Root227]
MSSSSDAVATQWTQAGLGLPPYRRGPGSAGIAHIGVGNFHRAHQAVVLDSLMRQGEATGWGILGIGVLPGDVAMRDALSAQDHLYTLTLRQPAGIRETSVIGSIVDYVFAPDDADATIERLADPAIRIVSLTITEGGYVFDANDLSALTAFRLITSALALRRKRSVPPFTVMSCDNVPQNGDVARSVVLDYARRVDPSLADWIATEVRFPNSMVDRITPVTTAEDRAALKERLGIDDAWPVSCEPFFQWVLEDSFSAGRPPFENSGVQIVDDVEPYELMKLRMLNAGHQAIAYFGLLLGYRYAHESAADPLVRDYLLAYLCREAMPTVPPVPGVDLDEYASSLLDRFASVEVQDTLDRLATDASNRLQKFVVPVIRANLQGRGPIDLAVAVVASWSYYTEQTTGPDSVDVVTVLGDLADDARVTDALARTVRSMRELGAEATLRALLARD